jgi:HSP20 family protein
VWKPAIELEEKDNQFRLEIAAPGIDPADINIEVTAEDILVSADVRHEHDETRRNVHICEFALGSLFRSIHLPKKIDPDRVKAEFKNGLVTLRAPLAEATRARKAKAGAV